METEMDERKGTRTYFENWIEQGSAQARSYNIACAKRKPNHRKAKPRYAKPA
jgi:hypothetical protein